jgi:hypothetical protein
VSRNDQLFKALTALARRLYERATRDTVERTTCAVGDLPMGQFGGISSVALRCRAMTGPN